MAFATNDGVRIYWRLDGAADKPVLVLLNSIGTDLGLYDAAVPHLLPAFRLLRVDTRGHGASDAPAGDYTLELLAGDVLAVMDAAGVAKANVCGVSLGGMIAMTLALKTPERIDSLVLACTSAAMDAVGWSRRIALIRAEGMAAVTDMVLGRFFSDAFRAAHSEAVETVRTGFLALSVEGYTGCGAAIRDMDLLGCLPDVAAPTLVIGGLKDVSTPFEGHGDRIVSAIPGARATMLDTAHLSCLEDPKAFAGAVRGFLAEIIDERTSIGDR